VMELTNVSTVTTEFSSKFLIFVELLSRGVSLELVDKDGCSALDIAARYGQSEHIELLVKRSAHFSKKILKIHTGVETSTTRASLT
jgi:ankyrin repeat protein